MKSFLIFLVCFVREDCLVSRVNTYITCAIPVLSPIQNRQFCQAGRWTYRSLKEVLRKKKQKTDSIITRPWKLSRKFCTVTSFHIGDGGLEPLIKSPSFLEAPSPLIMENVPKISWSWYFSENIFRSLFFQSTFNYLLVYFSWNKNPGNLTFSKKEIYNCSANLLVLWNMSPNILFLHTWDQSLNRITRIAFKNTFIWYHQPKYTVVSWCILRYIRQLP